MEQEQNLERRISSQYETGLDRRDFLKILIVGGYGAFASSNAFSQQADEKAKPRITIKTDGSISEGEGQRLVKEVEEADKTVSDYLRMYFEGVYKIDVARNHRTSRALLHVYGGNRGVIDFPAISITKDNAAVIHEVTHVIAPNYNRFMAEGLAVYIQNKFSTKGVPPTYSTNLHKGATENKLKLEDLIKETKDYYYYWSRKNIGSAEMRNAYFHAGSFVQFLIENDAFGVDEKLRLEKFKELYQLADKDNAKMFEIVYGKPLTDIEKEWHSYIERRISGLPQFTVTANNQKFALIT